MIFLDNFFRLNLDASSGGDLLEPQLGGALLGDLLGSLSLLLDRGRLLLKDHLDVGGLGHVGADATVGPVGAAASAGGAVALDVRDDEVLPVHRLGLGVGLGVLDEVEDDLGGLNGPPAGVSGGVDLLSLGVVADSSGVLGEGDGGLELEDVVHELLGLGGGHAVDVVGNFAAVLEVDTEVGAAALGDLALVSQLN